MHVRAHTDTTYCMTRGAREKQKQTVCERAETKRMCEENVRARKQTTENVTEIERKNINDNVMIYTD